jgi:IS1 family transposase
MWSFVWKRKNKVWIWLAIDIETGEIVGVFVGSRDIKGAQDVMGFSNHLFIVNVLFRNTDFWTAYDAVFPKKRHKSVGKETGQTNRIERCCTVP